MTGYTASGGHPLTARSADSTTEKMILSVKYEKNQLKNNKAEYTGKNTF